MPGSLCLPRICRQVRYFPMKLLSWNVNGLRAVMKKGFADWLVAEDPDILCIQESKARPEDITELLPAAWRTHWCSAEKKGYSGTVIFTKEEPLRVTRGIGVAEHDTEGRVISAEYPDFHLVNVYVPNSKRDLARLPYRQQWDAALLGWLKGLEQTKPVIWCGDLNVAHREIDLTYPKQNVKNHGFTPEERAGFDAFVNAGFVDTFREFQPAGGHYTWWSQMNNARSRNIGWRIDYFLVSAALRPRLQRAWILPEVMGSDHCPVGLEIAPSAAVKPAKKAAKR